MDNTKLSKRIFVVLLSIILLGSGIGVSVYAFAEKNDNKNKENEIIEINGIEKELNSKKHREKIFIKSDEDLALSKHETVYVVANEDGSVKKVIVSDWLKNINGEPILSDYSELSNVVNVKGDESYSLDKNNMLVWNSEGNDIYYQGTTDKSLPIDISISYFLDNKPITLDELAGKSGKVTIRFDYTNNEKRIVKIDGKQETIYVPFIIVTGMVLDQDNFDNVSISNGKIINDGNRNVVMGFAMPGLQESLNINKADYEIPNFIEIKADVTNFELTTTLTVATNELFSDIKIGNDLDLNELVSGLNELSDASNKLSDGSSKLYDGVSELLDKSGELIYGINKLADGAKTLNDGANNLYKGTEELQIGVDGLNAGLNSLVANNTEILEASKQVFDSLLNTANNQLAASGLEIPKLTIDNYAVVLDKIIEANKDVPTLIKLKAELDSYNQFYTGLKVYTDGVSQACAGSSQLMSGTGKLKDGAKQLANGSNELSNGLYSLKDGSNKLAEGISQLKNGSMELSDGMKEFNEKGIQKLTDALDKDISQIVDRLRAVINISK